MSTNLKYDQSFEHFSEILNLLKSGVQYERIFHTIVYQLTSIFKCQSCAIILISPKTEYLNVVNSQGLSHTFCNEYRKHLATGAIGKLLWTGKPIIIKDSAADSLLASEVQLEHPFGSCVCVQISIDHRTLGFLYVDSKSKYAFDEKDISSIQMYADAAALAFHKHTINEENLRLDNIDHETEVDKYSPFIQKLKFTFERSKKNNEPFSLLILDVDNFKTINNTYGHESGIQMLRQIIDLIKIHIKSVHHVGRYGFDELIVLLENTDLDPAIRQAVQLKDAVEKTNFTAHNFSSTVSIGVASYPRNTSLLDELIVTAKNAIFEAQRTGKNCVFHYEKEWYSG